jgi:transcriptional regulator with XRE-family HTH domain
MAVFVNNTGSRIIKLVEKLGMSDREFARLAGFSNSLLYTIRHKNATIGSDKLENILQKLTDLSAEWLLRGEGDMFRKVDNTYSIDDTSDADVNESDPVYLTGRPNCIPNTKKENESYINSVYNDSLLKELADFENSYYTTIEEKHRKAYDQYMSEVDKKYEEEVLSLNREVLLQKIPSDKLSENEYKDLLLKLNHYTTECNKLKEKVRKFEALLDKVIQMEYRLEVIKRHLNLSK